MDEKLLEFCNDKQYLGNNNFVIPNELTVTITLEEYRQLVSTAAKAEQYNAQKTEWELKQEIDKLKQRIVELTTVNVGGMTITDNTTFADCNM